MTELYNEAQNTPRMRASRLRLILNAILELNEEEAREVTDALYVHRGALSDRQAKARVQTIIDGYDTKLAVEQAVYEKKWGTK